MQDQTVFPDPQGVQDILAALSRQIKAVAFGVCYATDDGMSYTQNALWGMSDILHKVAAGIDDLAELPLPTLEELGDEARLVRLARLRISNNRAADLLYRIRQLGSFQRVDLINNLRTSYQKTCEVEEGLGELVELFVYQGNDDLVGKIHEVKNSSAEAVQTLEASLGELRRLNSQVAQILPVIEEVQQDKS